MFHSLRVNIPMKSTGLTRDDINTSKTQVSFSWTAPNLTAAFPVLDYSIQWDQGTGVYVQAASSIPTTGLSYTMTGLTAGVTYKFKVYARNSIGLGKPSDEFSIIAGIIPSTPAAPTTSYNGSTDTVTIDCNPPADNGGLSI